MATRGVWIPEFLVHICCFSSLITSTYVKNLVPYVQKELPDLRRCICHSYIKHSADWASLKWPHRQLCKGFKFHGCLREREIADERYDGPTVALCLLMCESQYSHTPYSLQSTSLMKRCGLPPPVAVKDYIGCGCHAVFFLYACHEP